MEYYTKSGVLSKKGREHNQYIESSITVFQEAMAAVKKCEMKLVDYNLVNNMLTEYLMELSDKKLPKKRLLPGPMLCEISSTPIERKVLLVDENGNVSETTQEMRPVNETLYIGTKKCIIPYCSSHAYEVFVMYPQYSTGFSPGKFAVNRYVCDVLELCKYNNFLDSKELMKRLSEIADAGKETPMLYLELARRIDHSVYEKCLYQNERRKQQ